MSNKKIMILIIILMAAISIAAVSANENPENITANEEPTETITLSADDTQLQGDTIDDEDLSRGNEEILQQNEDENPLKDNIIDTKLEIVKYPSPGETAVVIQLSKVDTNEPVSGVKLKVSSKFASKCLTTDSNGQVTYNFPAVIGTHKMDCGLYVDENTITTLTNNIRIQDFIDTEITISGIPVTLSTSHGKSFQIKAVHTKNKSPVNGAKIYLKIYTGKKYKKVTLTTNSQGIANYNPGKLSAGKHKIVVSVDNKNAISKSKTTTITIKKHKPKITAPEKRNIYKTGKFQITVKNKKYGNAMSGIKVKLKVYTGKKYKTFNVKTDSKGMAKISTKSMSKGKHKVIISIKSNSKHKAASKKSSITIVKTKTQPKIGFSGKVYEYHYASSGLCDGVTIYPKMTGNGKELKKKLTVKTAAGTYSGYSGQGIFLPNVYSDDGNPVFVPLSHGGSAKITFAEDNYYLKAECTITF